MDGDGSDNLESGHPDSPEQSPNKNTAVTVENLAADRKSLSQKIKTTLSQKYGQNGTEHLSSFKKEKARNVSVADPEEGVDNAVDSSEQDTAKHSKVKATVKHPSKDLSTGKEEDIPSKTVKYVGVNPDVMENHNQEERSSVLPLPQTIVHDPSGFARPTRSITELIDEIPSIAYKCRECDIDLNDHKAWKSHLKLHDIDVKDLTESERISHGECLPNFDCVICGWLGKKKSGLQTHLKSHENDVACDVCGLMYRKVKELKIHMRYHDFTEFQCVTCKKSFQNNTMLVRHEITHTTEKLKRDRHELLCEICSKIFHAPNVLALHLKTHQTQSSFRCENCDITFTKRSRLNKHIKNIHNNIKDSIICRFCRTQYDTKAELDEHLKEHIGEHAVVWKNNRPMNIRRTIFKCTHCDKVLHRKSNFDVHMMKHSGEKPFICDVCGVGFTIASTLKKHQLTHNGSKSHACPQCGKGFKLKSSLNRHLRIHSGEKPFVCKTCGKGFSDSSYLKKHQRVHGIEDDDEGKSLCSICHKRYRNIEVHMQSHFRNRPSIPNSFSSCLSKSTSGISESKKPELFIPTKISSFTEPISFHISRTLFKDLDKNSTNETVSKSKPNFGEGSDDVSTELSRALAEISKNVTTSSIHNMPDDDVDDDRFIGFDNDDNDDDDFLSENSQTSDANPNSSYVNLQTPKHHSVQDKNPEENSTNHTLDVKNDSDKIKVEAGQSGEIPKEFCLDICKDSKVLDNILDSPNKIDTGIDHTLDIVNDSDKTKVEAGQSEEIQKEPCQDICKDPKVLENILDSPNKIDTGIEAQTPELNISIEAETPVKKKPKLTEGCERKVRRSQRTKLKSDYKEVLSIGEVDFDKDDDDNTEADSIIQKAMSHLDNLIEDQNASDKITKPTRRYRKRQLITCEVCGDEFQDTLTYEAHLHNHTSSDELSTDIIWDFFENHNGNYNCKTCDVTCKDKGTAFVHSKFHLGMAHTCDICDKSFQLAESLKKHYMCHGSYKRYKCESCNSGFNSAYRLKRHLLIHLNMRNFMCETCGGKFNTLTYLNQHKKIHGSAGEEKNRKQRNRYKSRAKPQCPICGIIVRELKDHIATHGEKKFKCDKCDKSYASRRTLNKHSRVHVGIKKCICPYESCGKAFYEKSFLNRHLLLHEQRKNFNSFKCDLCVATYSKDADLQKHYNLHKTSKWSCDICKRVFHKQNKLIAHSVVHTGEKPYKCDRCKAAFTQKGDLQRHMREYHSSLSKLNLT